MKLRSVKLRNVVVSSPLLDVSTSSMKLRSVKLRNATGTITATVAEILNEVAKRKASQCRDLRVHGLRERSSMKLRSVKLRNHAALGFL